MMMEEKLKSYCIVNPGSSKPKRYHKKPATVSISKTCICCLSKNDILINLDKCQHTSFLWNIYNIYQIKDIEIENRQVCLTCHNMLKKIYVFQKQVTRTYTLLCQKVKSLKIIKNPDLQYSSIHITDSTKPFDGPPILIAKNEVDPIELAESSKPYFDGPQEFIVKTEINQTDSTDTYFDIEESRSDVKLGLDPIDIPASTDANLTIEKPRIIFKTDIDPIEDKIISNVKLEHDYCNLIPTPKSLDVESKNIKKADACDKYDGKLISVFLTLNELIEEREFLANQSKYKNLPYKCKDCIVAFDHELSFKTHIEQRHIMKNGGSRCNICKSVLNTKASYNAHVKRHYRRIVCEVCGKRYSHLNSAVQHYDENHMAPGSSLRDGFTCAECGFTTMSNRMYRYHLDKHRRKAKCNLCGNVFVNQSSLKCHMYTVHQQSDRKYRCDACNKTYRASSGLKAHMRSVHETSSQAYCEPCRTFYVSKYLLKVHQRTHSSHVTDSDKKFVCDECGAKFVRKANLRIHINWEHSRANLHPCLHCTKVFKTGPSMRRHVTSVHEMKRPARDKICHFCGRVFTTKAILQSHIRTHTGERPLKCELCDATFAHSGALYTHKKLKHRQTT